MCNENLMAETQRLGLTTSILGHLGCIFKAQQGKSLTLLLQKNISSLFFGLGGFWVFFGNTLKGEQSSKVFLRYSSVPRHGGPAHLTVQKWGSRDWTVCLVLCYAWCSQRAQASSKDKALDGCWVASWEFLLEYVLQCVENPRDNVNSAYYLNICFMTFYFSLKIYDHIFLFVSDFPLLCPSQGCK